MKWLKRNWVIIVITICMALTIIYILDSKLAEKDYKEKIENLDTDILRLEDVNKVIRGINDDLRIVRAEDKAVADKKIADMKSNQKRELARIDKEREEERARVENLPASEVVVETRVILLQRAKENVAIEIWERPGGILFSLITAKTNLAILVDFSLVEEKRDQWREDYFKAMEGIKEKDEIIAGGEVIFKNFRVVISNLEKAGEKKDEKFNKSEKRNRQMYWKGIKHGSPIGAGIVALLWLVLGK